MELNLPKDQLARYLKGMARVGSCDVRLWGEGQRDEEIGDERIFGTAFQSDPASVRETMVGRILASQNSKPKNVRGLGGIKIRDEAVWDSPEGRLFTLRALILFCKRSGAERAFTVDRWANVMEGGDYSCPHSHYESEAALVYFLDLGEEAKEHPFSGRFEFLDPRIPFCCSKRPEAPTRGLMPELVNGLLIMFPSELIHYVHPYSSSRPRITLAFNISEGAEPDGHGAKLAGQVEGEFGKV